jgi:hypothetical protein
MERTDERQLCFPPDDSQISRFNLAECDDLMDEIREEPGDNARRLGLVA